MVKAGQEKGENKKRAFFFFNKRVSTATVRCDCAIASEKSRVEKMTADKIPNQHTSLCGTACVCTALSRPFPHRAHFLGLEFRRRHQSHFYLPPPQRTAAPLDTAHNRTTQQITTDFFFFF